MNKYEKLQKDLTEAVAKAKEKAMTTDDGGTCNFDCCMLFLPGYNEVKTVEAIKAAGVSGFKSRHFGKVCYMLSNPIFSQGNQRTEQAEEIEKKRKDKHFMQTLKKIPRAKSTRCFW